MTIDHRAAAKTARDMARDHAILHGPGSSAAERFAALERSQKDADARRVAVAAAYLDVLDVMATLRRVHESGCVQRSACTCGATAHNARIDAVVGQPESR
ncbi:MAG: hypothetical protein ACKVWV_12255 [Planctomycetota bacterium]